jgi:DNA-binding transcriptional MerR regulator
MSNLKNDNNNVSDIGGLENQIDPLAGELGIITSGKMIRKLRDLGYSLREIEAITEIANSVLEAMAGDKNPSDPSNESHSALYRFYILERIKSVYRASAFIGPVKAAARLQIRESDFLDFYDALLRSGEITITEEHPEWKTGESTTPLQRRHVK